MPQAYDSRRGHVSIIDIRNSLNIHFTGIHALAKLFSVKLYKTRDQYEICTTIFENVSFNGVLVYVCIIEPSHQWRRALNDDWTSLTHGERQHLDRLVCVVVCRWWCHSSWAIRHGDTVVYLSSASWIRPMSQQPLIDLVIPTGAEIVMLELQYNVCINVSTFTMVGYHNIPGLHMGICQWSLRQPYHRCCSTCHIVQSIIDATT